MKLPCLICTPLFPPGTTKIAITSPSKIARAFCPGIRSYNNPDTSVLNAWVHRITINSKTLALNSLFHRPYQFSFIGGKIIGYDSCLGRKHELTGTRSGTARLFIGCRKAPRISFSICSSILRAAVLFGFNCTGILTFIFPYGPQKCLLGLESGKQLIFCLLWANSTSFTLRSSFRSEFNRDSSSVLAMIAPLLLSVVCILFHILQPFERLEKTLGGRAETFTCSVWICFDRTSGSLWHFPP